MNVFTYGTLMFERIWLDVIGNVYRRVNARLYGYVRWKVKNETYPAILPGPSENFVDGIAYLDVTSDDVARLDRFEGEYYQRQLTECELTDARKLNAHVYVLKSEYKSLIEDKQWDPEWFSRFGISSFLMNYKGFDEK